jgi:Protein of unknown function (DUF2889)
MPLSPGAPRRPFHARRIFCEGFLRDDGLWDIEGHILDTKPYAYEESHRGRMEPGRPVHEMRIRVTLDHTLEIKAIEAVTDAGPFPVCHDVGASFGRLVGLRIGPGWRRRLRELLGGPEGCTHLVELLHPIATVAFQTIFSKQAPEPKEGPPEQSPKRRRPYFIDGCRAWAADGPVVRDLFPQFYRGERD